MSGDTTPNKDALWRQYLKPHERVELRNLDLTIEKLTKSRRECLDLRRKLMQAADRRARRAGQIDPAHAVPR